MRKDLSKARELYLLTECGLTDQEVARQAGISRATAWRWRKELDCRIVAPGRYVLRISQEDASRARAILKRWEGQVDAED